MRNYTRGEFLSLTAILAGAAGLAKLPFSRARAQAAPQARGVLNRVGQRERFTPEQRRERNRQGMRHISELLTAAGLTTVHDAGAGADRIRAYEDARAAGELRHRAYLMVLKAYERVLARWPHQDRRHRIEHCSLVDPDLLRRIKATGSIPTPFWTYIYYHGEKWSQYGDEKMRWMFAHRSFLDAGIRPRWSRTGSRTSAWCGPSWAGGPCTPRVRREELWSPLRVGQIPRPVIGG
ncbi:MAG TPA: hypothetical protein VF178_13555 [Gemmatimonadaceae bacterium]